MKVTRGLKIVATACSRKGGVLQTLTNNYYKYFQIFGIAEAIQPLVWMCLPDAIRRLLLSHKLTIIPLIYGIRFAALCFGRLSGNKH